MGQIEVGVVDQIESITAEERAWLVRLCARLADDRDVAEDLTQETLITAWRISDRRPSTTLQETWLARIAYNVCRDWVRRQRRDQARRVGLYANDGATAPVEMWIAADDVQDEVERSELAHLLQKALSLLPDKTRTALVLCHVLGLPQASVAAH